MSPDTPLLLFEQQPSVAFHERTLPYPFEFPIPVYPCTAENVPKELPVYRLYKVVVWQDPDTLPVLWMDVCLKSQLVSDSSPSDGVGSVSPSDVSEFLPVRHGVPVVADLTGYLAVPYQ